MPRGLKFQRKHRCLGYKIKYIYYLFNRRDILQKKASYGNSNVDKIIYIIKPDFQDGVEGLLSLIYRQVLYISYAKNRGYIPYVDWKNYKTQYYDGQHNAWEYFFEQPSRVTEEEAGKSKNVVLSGWTFKDINPNGLFDAKIFFDRNLRKQSHELLIDNLTINSEVINIVNQQAKELDIYNCIGVYVRGTDYIKMKPSGEYVQPNVEQVVTKVQEFMSKYNLPIYLVTEDGNIYDKFIDAFGKRVRIVSFDTFVRNYDGKDVLSKSNVLEEDKKSRGQKYLVKMILLSKCKYLISSITQGSKFSYLLNGGKYEDEFIFDLGLYK